MGGTHFIKVKKKTEKTWKFLTRQGVNQLRIHALRFSLSDAESLIAENQADNPEWDFKIVPID